LRRQIQHPQQKFQHPEGIIMKKAEKTQICAIKEPPTYQAYRVTHAKTKTQLVVKNSEKYKDHKNTINSDKKLRSQGMLEVKM
jgi:hypothetical protein